MKLEQEQELKNVPFFNLNRKQIHTYKVGIIKLRYKSIMTTKNIEEITNLLVHIYRTKARIGEFNLSKANTLGCFKIVSQNIDLVIRSPKDMSNKMKAFYISLHLNKVEVE